MRTTVPEPTPDRSRAAPGVTDPPTDPLAALLPHHRRMLVDESGIAPEVVAERRYRSLRQADAGRLRTLGFTQRGLSVPGLLVPVWAPDGTDGRYQYRPDAAWRHKDGRAAKYVSPPRTAPCLDVPPRCRAQIRDADVPLYVTEGAKKADAAASRGLCALALAGVWNWVGRNEYGSVTSLPEWRDVALKGRLVYVVFDSDAVAKLAVWQAMEALTGWLQAKGATPKCLRLPAGPNDEKVGLDDFLRDHGTAALARLADAPAPERPKGADEVEWLDEAPPAMPRPLALIGGRAYAATSIHVRRREYGDDGRVREVVAPALVVVRDDGEAFGPGRTPLDRLGVDVRLPHPVRDVHAWRAPAVKRYLAGGRVRAADVFGRVRDVYDHFLDLHREPGRQRALCELSACFSLLTWLTPAMTSLGYVWPNGPAGSGKTHYADVWAATSYLGQLVLSSGTFASLRDLADYGAALAFDDAEKLADPKKSDPSVRELLLAGHHRGAVVTLKEPAPDGTWRTRYIDAFAPRAFTAIKVPDPTLASRSVVVSLVRTDSAKGNRDPADRDRWPHDHRRLTDDLWAWALAALPRAKALWAELEGEADVIGRDYQPWRPVLLVARLVAESLRPESPDEELALRGLEQRLRALMAGQHEDQADLLPPDRTVLVLCALAAMTGAKVTDGTDGIEGIYSKEAGVWRLPVAAITEGTQAQARAAGVDDVEWITKVWVSRVCGQLHFKGRSDGKQRFRLVDEADLAAHLRAYRLTARAPMPSVPPVPGVAVDATVSTVNDGPAAATTAASGGRGATVNTVAAVNTVRPDGRERPGPCAAPGCPNPGIPAGALGDGTRRCAEHHLAWVRRRGGAPTAASAAAPAETEEDGTWTFPV
jgi:Domain of unknown function (DUF3854)